MNYRCIFRSDAWEPQMKRWWWIDWHPVCYQDGMPARYATLDEAEMRLMEHHVARHGIPPRLPPAGLELEWPRCTMSNGPCASMYTDYSAEYLNMVWRIANMTEGRPWQNLSW
jgi:hypothetical protein